MQPPSKAQKALRIKTVYRQINLSVKQEFKQRRKE